MEVNCLIADSNNSAWTVHGEVAACKWVEHRLKCVHVEDEKCFSEAHSKLHGSSKAHVRALEHFKGPRCVFAIMRGEPRTCCVRGVDHEWYVCPRIMCNHERIFHAQRVGREPNLLPGEELRLASEELCEVELSEANSARPLSEGSLSCILGTSA